MRFYNANGEEISQDQFNAERDKGIGCHNKGRKGRWLYSAEEQAEAELDRQKHIDDQPKRDLARFHRARRAAYLNELGMEPDQLDIIIGAMAQAQMSGQINWSKPMDRLIGQWAAIKGRIRREDFGLPGEES